MLVTRDCPPGNRPRGIPVRALIIWFGIGPAAVATAGGALAQNSIVIGEEQSANDNRRAPGAQQRLHDHDAWPAAHSSVSDAERSLPNHHAESATQSARRRSSNNKKCSAMTVKTSAFCDSGTTMIRAA
jgi:hypothetical protein